MWSSILFFFSKEHLKKKKKWFSRKVRQLKDAQVAGLQTVLSIFLTKEEGKFSHPFTLFNELKGHHFKGKKQNTNRGSIQFYFAKEEVWI